jgi:hypothetical protein
VKGFRNSPYGERRIGALTAIKARAPVLGGNFGVWGGLFSTFDCAVKGVRKKEDPYNASMSSRRIRWKDSVLDSILTENSYCRILHWRCFGCKRRVQSSEKLCNRMRMFIGSYRRSRNRFPENDGREHKTRGMPLPLQPHFHTTTTNPFLP